MAFYKNRGILENRGIMRTGLLSINKVLTLLKTLKMEIRNFQILALMICNIASAVKVSDHTPPRPIFESYFYFPFFSSSNPPSSRRISNWHLGEMYFGRTTPGIVFQSFPAVLFWYQSNSKILTEDGFETVKRNVLEWTKLVKLWREDITKKSITLKWDASSKLHVSNIFRELTPNSDHLLMEQADLLEKADLLEQENGNSGLPMWFFY